MLKNYIDVRNWLENFIPLVYGKEELGLKRIENLLSRLGNPEKKFKSIHVGGTSGKGSTCFYICELLINKGYKVGLHTSPHLVDIRERMVIGGKLMPEKRFVDLANKVSAVVDDIKRKQPQLTPSYFEILVAMSFLYFAEEKVDWAVVEVGLGGRLDATNVLLPKITTITNVGLDHTEILGDTVEKIAREKSGIIKTKVSKVSKGTKVSEGVPIITAASGEALNVIEKAAKDKKALLCTLDTQGNLKTPKSDTLRSVSKQYYSLRPQDTLFALQNKNLALATVLSLGVDLDPETAKKAFSRSYPGRFEVIDENVVVDGAHNEDKIEALIKVIRDQRPGTRVVLVVAFKQGKAWEAMIDLLLHDLPVVKLIATEYQGVTDMGKGSAVPANEIGKYLKKGDQRLEVKVIKNTQEAVFNAIQLSNHQSNQLVLVTGSLYLVGEARTLWQLPSFT